MALYIANPEADRLARELSAQTGETLTDAVIAALRERLDRARAPAFDARLARAMEIAREVAATLNGREVNFDELYDDQGLPA